MNERTNASELMHREIDGECTPEEAAELKRRLAQDSNLRSEHEKLTALSHSLAAVGQEEPPQGLVADVMRALRLRPSRGPSWLDVWRAAFGTRPMLAPALSLAVGILIGAFSVGLVGPSSFMAHDETAAGTILPADRLGSQLQVDRQELIAEGVQGEAIMKRRGDELSAELQIASQKPLQIDLEFDPRVLAPLAFERETPSEEKVLLEPGRVRFAHAGSGKYKLVLGLKSPADPAIRLRAVGDTIALERTLEAGGE
jgi:hypothetical protein